MYFVLIVQTNWCYDFRYDFCFSTAVIDARGSTHQDSETDGAWVPSVWNWPNVRMRPFSKYWSELSKIFAVLWLMTATLTAMLLSPFTSKFSRWHSLFFPPTTLLLVVFAIALQRYAYPVTRSKLYPYFYMYLHYPNRAQIWFLKSAWSLLITTIKSPLFAYFQLNPPSIAHNVLNILLA
jgi:hypothetical protein